MENFGKPDEIICSILAVHEWPNYKSFKDKTAQPCNCLPTCNMATYAAIPEAFIDEISSTNKTTWHSEIWLKFSNHVAETRTKVTAYKL
jgi:hypothetical protein